MADSNQDSRFGAVAVEMGFATLDDVLAAMNIQVQENIENRLTL